jgi:hypothetical protein
VAGTGRARRPSGGGAATHAGTSYQNRAAAWVAVRILAEQSASPPWDLPAAVALELIACETDQPVDDFSVRSSDAGLIFAQAKHSLSLSEKPDSDLASSLDQFVRQFLQCRDATGNSPWNRPLDPARDRLVLVTSPDSSAPIREHLPPLLARLRALPAGQSIDDAPVSEQERKVLRVLRGHLERSWHSLVHASPTEDDVRQVLSLVRVHVLDVDSGGSSELEAKDLLRSVVLRGATLADLAWNTLVETCTGFAANRSGGDRTALQRVLLDAGIDLQAPRSYRTDIDQLREYSASTVSLLAGTSKIRVSSAEVKILKRSTEVLASEASHGSLLVIGEPGAGKSGALHDLAVDLHDAGHDLVCLTVDRVEAQSLGALRSEIGLAHDLLDVLRNWPGCHPAFLIIDALDAARSDQSAGMLRDLISQVHGSASRWRIIASVRKFDLRYSHGLRQLFSGSPPTEFADSEFTGVRHINIPLLDDGELGQIRGQSAPLGILVDGAPEALHDMLRVPFNLRLAGELLGEGISPGELTPIRTQVELLDRYWHFRVLRSDGQGDAREHVLRRATEAMVESRTLRADRAVVVDASTSAALDELLSSHVLTEWQPSPVAMPDRYVLTFAHHVLFDYSVARLLLRGLPEKFVTRLVNDPDLVLAIRPSLVLHWQHVWWSDSTRAVFWQFALPVIQEGDIREVAKLIPPTVAADSATQLTDFDPLLQALDTPDSAARQAAERALRHVVDALLTLPPDQSRPLTGEDAGPWCALLEHISRSTSQAVVLTTGTLLDAVRKHSERVR